MSGVGGVSSRTVLVVGVKMVENRVEIKPRVVSALGERGGDGSRAGLFPDDRSRRVAALVLGEIERFRELPTSRELRLPGVRGEIVSGVTAKLAAGEAKEVEVNTIVETSLVLFERLTIDIPRIALVTDDPLKIRFTDFDLDGARLTAPRVIGTNDGEPRGSLSLHDFLTREIYAVGPFTFERDIELIQKIAAQAIDYARVNFGADFEAILTVTGRHSIAHQIFDQFYEHELASVPRWEEVLEIGFLPLQSFDVESDLLRGVPPLSRCGDGDRTETELFGGFYKCLYGVQRLSTPTMRRVARELERRRDVLKWFRPTPGQFEIFWGHRHAQFTVDFVVETETERLLYEEAPVEESFTTRLRRKVAERWCASASNQAAQHGAKKWRYIEIYRQTS